MNTLVALFLCIQAFLIQNVFSQCSGSYGSEVINNAGYSSGITAIPPAAISSSLGRGIAGLGYTGFGVPGPLSNTGNLGYEAASGAAYSGTGEGNVAVAGELRVAGNTYVIGQVPILGFVGFNGNLPAAGFVTISGRCSCGCDNY